MFYHKQETIIENVLINLTIGLIFLLPVMIFNPMNPLYHRLQLSELVFIPCLILTVALVLRGRIVLTWPGKVFWSAVLFIVLTFIASFLSHVVASVVEASKLLYLFILSCVIYLVGKQYKLETIFWKIFCFGFLIILLSAILGILLLCASVPNFLANKTSIIPIALGVEKWIPFVPRVTSVLRPTANMTGAYLAVTTLPVVNYIFNYFKWAKFTWVRYFLLIVVVSIGFLTMSRTLVGIMLAIYFGFEFFNWPIFWRSFISKLILVAAVLMWSVLLFYSILYPAKVKVSYQTYPNYQKEMVVLDGVPQPNPVYYFRANKGLETVNVSFGYGFNHYGWLKYGGLEILKTHPWFGVGLSNYPLGMKKLANAGIIPQPLTKFISAQSQYATILAETGILGTLALLGVFYFCLRAFYSYYKESKDLFALSIFLSLIILAIIAIDIDVISFRWLWGMLAISLLYCRRNKRDESVIS